MLNGTGAIHIYNDNKAMVLIPSVVWRDSAFFFKDKDKVSIRIDGARLIIERI